MHKNEIRIKTKEQLNGIRESGKRNIEILDMVSEKIEQGMTTEELDRIVFERTKELGGIPAPLHYEGFPKSVCTSINNQVCHGIPSQDVVIQDGDIINVDVSTIYDNYFSDSSRMFKIGKISPKAGRLVEVTKECVERGLAQVYPGNRFGTMGHAVHQHAKNNGYTVVSQIGGHGVGIEFHEEPYVSFVSKAGTGAVFVPGMVFTIEPMVNAGKDRIYIDGNNNWTVYTMDGKLSAQWEVMLAVTEKGYEIMAY
ncbi:MAG: type I methionyl aminopeptidase [Lachnospiraceae bacterium]